MRGDPTERESSTRQRDPHAAVREVRIARRYDAIGALAVLIALLGAALGLHDSARPAPRAARARVESSPATADPAQMPSSLQGTVRDVDGQPIAEATICASPVDDAARVKPNHCVVADGHGAYFFANLVPAAYVVTAAADGFEPGVAQAGRPLKLTGYGSMIGVDVVLHAGARRVEDPATRGGSRGTTRASQRATPLVAPARARGRRHTADALGASQARLDAAAAPP